MIQKLSIVIITFNEEKNIRRCIESAQEIADEIIVLDSFSTDATESICNELGVTFSKHKFDGHIQQKNRVMQMAANDWVLSLDADEAPDERLMQNIKMVMQAPTADAYYFNRKTSYLGKWIEHSGWYPDKKLRLLKKSKGKWGGINPHDKIEMQSATKQEYIKGDLLHYSFYSIEQHIAQVNSFTTIAAKVEFEKGKKSNWFIAFYKSSWKFIRDYFFKRGFLDGYYGFLVCSISAFATFSKYIKLTELRKNKRD
ncbi:MAG: glycosyltransferase family 2 protein [Bacteroidales bacterium]|nr:glycosyltransferase family 2 protein [Bacteroidales bacterium]